MSRILARIGVLAVWGTGVVACGQGAPAAPEPARAASAPAEPAEAIRAVVYGEDDRTEWFAVTDPAQRELMRSAIAAMVPIEDVRRQADGNYDVVSYQSVGEYNGMCADQRFYDEPTAAACSGTLIDRQLLLTAGHCVSTLADCASNAWVFDYRYEAQGHLATVGPDSVYHCVDLVTNGFDDRGNGYDFAIVQLDRPVLERTPAIVRSPGPVDTREHLTLIGFPNGIPMKLAGNGVVVDARATHDTYFVGAVDAFYGNSGSGVFDEHMQVTGVLVNGADDYVDAGSCSIVQVLDPSDGEEEMTYAASAVTTLCEKHYPSAALCGASETATCGDGWCTGDETHATCAGDCNGLLAVPAEWSCNFGFYAAQDGCDCACGVLDPDCKLAGQDVYGCAPGSACQADGACATPIPAAWFCAPDYYGVGDDCDCGCGAYDPDCDNGNARVLGCVRGTACLPDGACEEPIPDTWTCPNRWYATRDGCDCDCGAPDRDCEDPTQEVSGCVPGSACQADGTCVASVPTGWVCDRQLFGTGGDCDCNCGAYDPDCAAPGAAVLNCGASEGCGEGGVCGAAEPGPEAEVVEAGPEAEASEGEVAAEVAEVAETEADAVESDVVEGDVEGGETSAPDTIVTDTIVTTEAGDVAEATGPISGHASGAGCAGGDAGMAPGAVAGLLGLVGLRALGRRRLSAGTSTRNG